MTQYFTDFSDSAAGDNPPDGWTRRGAASSSPGSYAFTVRNQRAAFKNRAVKMSFTGSDVQPAISWDAIDADANRAAVEICFLATRPLTDELTNIQGVVRGQGTSSVTDGYQFAVEWGSNRLRIYKVSGGVRTNPFADLSLPYLDPGATRRFVCRVSGDATTLLKVKSWLDGEAEPAAWELEESDSSSPVTAAGWVGFGGYISSPSSFTAASIPFFSVGTNGDSAPRGKTNLEYSQWLGQQTVERRVLAKFRATGYDSAGTPFTQTVLAYAANGGYTSKPYDNPPNQHFPPILKGIPSFDRQMGVALVGRATTSFGALRIANPVEAVVTYRAPSFRVDFTDAGSGVANTTPSIGTGSATFTRTGATATTVLSSGLISGTIAADTLRSYYDPVTLQGWGAIFEEERSNLLLQTTLPGGGATPTGWSAGPSGTSAAIASIYGNNDGAVAYTHTATAQRPFFTQVSPSLTASLTYRFSAYIEAVSGTVIAANAIAFNGPAGATASHPASKSNPSGSSSGAVQTGRILAGLLMGGTPGSTNARLGLGASSNSTGTLQFSRPMLELGSFPTTYIPTAGATATRAKDLLSYPVSGNLATNDVTAVIDWRPMSAGMGTVYLGGSYVDASNYTRVFHDGTNIVVRKRIGGVNYDATKALTYAAEQRYQIVARFSSTLGVDVFVDGVKGTGNADTTALQLGTNWQHMADGNGVVAGAMCSRFLAFYGAALNDGEVYNLSQGNLPVESSTTRGVRDDWTRAKWKKENIRVMLGDPDWALHDFRDVIVGRLGQPTTPADDEIEFPIQDLSGLLDVPLQENRFTSGPNSGQTKPRGFGFIRWCDVPVLDGTALTYQLNDGAVVHTASRPILVNDNGVPLYITSTAVTSVDAGANTFTKNAHGMLDGWVVYFSSTGTVPAPLVAGTFYYVKNATANTWQVEATIGGGVIDITTAGTGTISFVGFGYRIVEATGVMTLVSNPAGRITAFRMLIGAALADSNPAQMLDDILFDAGGLSAEYKDEDAFADLVTDFGNLNAGLLLQTGDNSTVAAAAQQLAAGTFMYFGWTPDGLMRPGRISLPASTTVLDLTASDVVDLRLNRVMLPVDFARSPFEYNAVYTSGQPITAKSGNAFYFVKPDVLAAYNYGAAGVPLDDHPDQADAEVRPFNTLFTDLAPSDEQDRLADLFLKKLGVFTFKTRFTAMQLAIGDTISLTHPRYGWKTWSASDPASPDNTATIDSTKAVVIGINTALEDQSPFPVTLTVMRPIIGYYPEEDFN